MNNKFIFSGGNDYKTLRISDSNEHSTVEMDTLSDSSKEEELTRENPENWVAIKSPVTMEPNSQKRQGRIFSIKKFILE